MKLKALGPRTELQYLMVLARAYGPSSQAAEVLRMSKWGTFAPGDRWARLRGWLPRHVEENPLRGPHTWGEGSRELLRAAIVRLYAESGREEEGRQVACVIPRKFRVTRTKPTPTEEELLRYEAAARALNDDGLEALALLPLYLGLRADELLSMPREAVKTALGRGILIFQRKGAAEAQLPVQQVLPLLAKLFRAPIAPPTGLEAKAATERLIASPTVSATDAVRARVWHVAGQILTRSERPATAYAALNALVREVANAAKLDAEHWTPHLLRHGFATRMNRDGAPLFTIQRALGHKNVATTQRYVKPTVEDVKVWMRPLPSEAGTVTLPTMPMRIVTPLPEATPVVAPAPVPEEAKPAPKPGFVIRRKGEPKPEVRKPMPEVRVADEDEEWAPEFVDVETRRTDEGEGGE